MFIKIILKYCPARPKFGLWQIFIKVFSCQNEHLYTSAGVNTSTLDTPIHHWTGGRVPSTNSYAGAGVR